MRTTLRAALWLACALCAGCAVAGNPGARRSDGGALPGPGSAAGGTGLDGGVTCAVASSEVVPSPVDVIIAIDQSASMGQEIQGVIDNINEHLAVILADEKIDYRVILVSGDFCIRPPLGSSDSAPACYGSNLPRFFHAPAPVNNSDALTLFLWTYDGFYKAPNTCNKLERPEVRWKDHLRYGSQKVFIVFSDDDPYSFSAAKLGCSNCPLHNCPTFADRTADWGGADFPTELYKLEPAGMFGTPEARKWTFHSVIGVDREYSPSDPVTPLHQICNYNGNTGETAGVEYQKLSKLTGGMRFPSCNTDYSPVFRSIAASIVPLACTYRLESTQNLGVIDPNRINVAFDPEDGSGVQAILKDDTAPCDAGANGWQFAGNNETIVLCGAICDAVKASPTGRVTITAGCQTRVRNNR